MSATPTVLDRRRATFPPVAPRSGRRTSRRLTEAGVWLPVSLMALSVLMRVLHVATAYDINSDEVNYTDLSISLQHGSFPPKFAGAPFVLHPPGFFAIGAAWLEALGVHGSYFHEVAALRTLNALLAGISAALIYALGVRMVGRSVGIGAGLLFALDPYILRQNERAMLETSTLMFLLAGYVVLVSLLDGRARFPRATAIGGGLLLGMSIVCKDMAGILVIVPLAVFLWKDVGIGRRALGAALVSALIPYALYVLALAAKGDFGLFVSQETLGVRRQLGLVQSTGFNAPGSPTLFSVAINQLAHYGVTYLISGLGVLSSVYLLLKRERPALRVWSVVTLAGAFSLAYSVAFGTVEEQMLYFMYVPAIVSLMAAVVVVARSRFEDRPVANHRFRRAVAWAVILFTVYDFGVWVQIRSTPSNGIERIAAWFQEHDPHPGVIGNDTEVTRLLLQRSGFDAIQISDPQTAASLHVRYLTILSASLVGNYGSLNPAQARFFEHYGRLVYQYHEGTYGTVSVYETTHPDIW